MRLKWKLDSVHSEVVLTLRQVRVLFVTNIPHAQKSFSMHPMEVQGEMGHVESCFGPFRDIVGVGAR
jgi:hypothetical protein